MQEDAARQGFSGRERGARSSPLRPRLSSPEIAGHWSGRRLCFGSANGVLHQPCLDAQADADTRTVREARDKVVPDPPTYRSVGRVLCSLSPLPLAHGQKKLPGGPWQHQVRYGMLKSCAHLPLPPGTTPSPPSRGLERLSTEPSQAVFETSSLISWRARRLPISSHGLLSAMLLLFVAAGCAH
nr:hypothetical protein CFP56_07670 [Quercus suber]